MKKKSCLRMSESLERGLEFGEGNLSRQISFAGWRRQFRDRDFKQGYLGEEIENMHLCTLFISLSSVEKKIIFSMHNDLHFAQLWQNDPLYLHVEAECLLGFFNHFITDIFAFFIRYFCSYIFAYFLLLLACYYCPSFVTSAVCRDQINSEQRQLVKN